MSAGQSDNREEDTKWSEQCEITVSREIKLDKVTGGKKKKRKITSFCPKLFESFCCEKVNRTRGNQGRTSFMKKCISVKISNKYRGNLTPEPIVQRSLPEHRLCVLLLVLRSYRFLGGNITCKAENR